MVGGDEIREELRGLLVPDVDYLDPVWWTKHRLMAMTGSKRDALDRSLEQNNIESKEARVRYPSGCIKVTRVYRVGRQRHPEQVESDVETQTKGR